MIVRILDEGQFELDDSHVEALGELDKKMLAAIEASDDDGFSAALEAVLATIHEHGEKVDDPTHIRPSELVVPAAYSTLEDVRSLLASEDVGED